MKKNLIIAIDGPAGSGKSTTAKLLAKKLNYDYIDTGAMYRAITYLAMQNNIKTNEVETLEKFAQSLIISFASNGEEIIINNQNISKEIREPQISENVSYFSKISSIRRILVEKQQELGKNGGVVMEGRDITTVVFPEADLKIYLTADISARAKRRKLELDNNGIGLEYSEVENNLIKRDEIDSTREVSPLTLANDAISIDTTNLTIEEQVERIFNVALELINK